MTPADAPSVSATKLVDDSYYAKRGWTEVGVLRGALRLGPDDVRDEHRFVKAVRSPSG